MGMIYLPNVAILRNMHARMAGGYSPIDGNSTLHYYATNMTFTSATVLADFTEIVLAGYTPYLLTGAADLGIVPPGYDFWQWPVNYTVAASTPSSPVTAWGYWVTSNDDGALLWCQQFDTPFTWATVGDSFPFQPALNGGMLGT